MHCASLGEFEQGRPLVEKIRTRYPRHEILISFFSPSGYEIRKNYEGADHVFYLPLPTRQNAREFIRILNPELVIWVKYEYWYHYLQILDEQKIPVLLVSALFRENQPFFKWYGGLHRRMLGFFRQIFVQNQESARLLAGIGIRDKLTIGGDTRFDRVVELAQKPKQYPEIERFCGPHPVIVAGSTWREDELAMDHFANRSSDLRFIIAPHEIHEEHLLEIEKMFSSTIRYSKWILNENIQAGSENPQILIIDNIGMLADLYFYASICYVGGGFGEDGVHNTLEAAVYGKPVVFGPEYSKYLEAVELVDVGAAFSVESALELEETLKSLLGSEDLYKQASVAAWDYVRENTGAADKIMAFIHSSGLLKTE